MDQIEHLRRRYPQGCEAELVLTRGSADAVLMEVPDLGGLWVPIITPLTGDGRVDDAALGRLAGRLLADGCAGLVVLGTTGEPATLDDHERRSVVDVCAVACAEAGKPLMVGVGSNCTRSTIEALLDVEDAVQPCAFLVVVPYYTRPSEDAILDHYRAVADASATAIVAYNVPYRTGRGLGSGALLELAGTPGIVGLKQAVAPRTRRDRLADASAAHDGGHARERRRNRGSDHDRRLTLQPPLVVCGGIPDRRLRAIRNRLLSRSDSLPRNRIQSGLDPRLVNNRSR